MNRTELAVKVAEQTELTTREALAAVEAAIDVIANTLLSGEKVKLPGFGNFEVRKRAARIGRNPRTGEEVRIPLSNVPVWKPAKAFKEAVK